MTYEPNLVKCDSCGNLVDKKEPNFNEDPMHTICNGCYRSARETEYKICPDWCGHEDICSSEKHADEQSDFNKIEWLESMLYLIGKDKNWDAILVLIEQKARHYALLERLKMEEVIKKEINNFSRSKRGNFMGDVLDTEVEEDGRVIIHYEDSDYTISDLVVKVLEDIKNKIL